jgi:hypothetical protein
VLEFEQGLVALRRVEMEGAEDRDHNNSLESTLWATISSTSLGKWRS